MGHSSIICALLQTCNQDEMAETAQNQNHANQVALARVESEYESYPATLAQMLQEGSCFQQVLRKRAQSNLVIHLLGAARDAELEWKYHRVTHWVDCYCQSLSELAETYRLKMIQVYLCGPDVTANDENATAKTKSIQQVSIQNQSGKDQLELFLCPGNYTQDVVSKIPKLDIAVMFNPGLTCPDYPSWNDTLYCIPPGTPILLCTNTQMEVLADIQFLLEHGHVRLNSLPPPWMGNSSPTPDDDAKFGGGGVNRSPSGNEEPYFWGENPYCGWRVRQSGTMANDVYVKNRWMFGGFIDRLKVQPARRQQVKSKSPPPLKMSATSANMPLIPEKEGTPSKKKRKVEENGFAKNNSKRTNPALI
jgi:hypothetical protein